MFSGIIEAVGTVHAFDRRGDDAVLEVAGGFDPTSLSLGESIATAGVCLTVRDISARGFVADLSQETLRRTTLGDLRPGTRVNLERSLRVGDRIGGHFVFGHVDAVGRIRALEKDGPELRLVVDVPVAGRYHLDATTPVAQALRYAYTDPAPARDTTMRADAHSREIDVGCEV